MSKKKNEHSKNNQNVDNTNVDNDQNLDSTTIQNEENQNPTPPDAPTNEGTTTPENETTTPTTDSSKANAKNKSTPAIFEALDNLRVKSEKAVEIAIFNKTGANELFKTSDGQYFADKNFADNHAKTLSNKTVKKVERK